jgi:hypothetical protein
MKLPPIDVNQMKWDQYEHFHQWRVGNGYGFSIVQFITGELGVVGTPRPDKRKTYESLGIAITSTADKDFNFFVPGESKPIPKAQLNYDGAQNLLVDLKSHRAVRIDRGYMYEQNLPKYLRRMSAVIPCEPPATPSRFDIGVPIGAPVSVYKPDSAPKALLEWGKQVQILAQAHVALHELGNTQLWDPTPISDAEVRKLGKLPEITSETPQDFIHRLHSNGSTTSIRRLADYGNKWKRQAEQHPYVLVA